MSLDKAHQNRKALRNPARHNSKNTRAHGNHIYFDEVDNSGHFGAYGPQTFNTQVGERLNILVHMRLTPSGGQEMVGGN